MKQIQAFTGSAVQVLCRDGSIIKGELAFYNWDAQVLHLCDFTIVLPDAKRIQVEAPLKTQLPKKGAFIVINKSDWMDLVIEE